MDAETTMMMTAVDTDMDMDMDTDTDTAGADGVTGMTGTTGSIGDSHGSDMITITMEDTLMMSLMDLPSTTTDFGGTALPGPSLVTTIATIITAATVITTPIN